MSNKPKAPEVVAEKPKPKEDSPEIKAAKEQARREVTGTAEIARRQSLEEERAEARRQLAESIGDIPKTFESTRPIIDITGEISTLPDWAKPFFKDGRPLVDAIDQLVGTAGSLRSEADAPHHKDYKGPKPATMHRSENDTLQAFSKAYSYSKIFRRLFINHKATEDGVGHNALARECLLVVDGNVYGYRAPKAAPKAK